MELAEGLLDVRFTSVLRADRIAFPTVNLSCDDIAALAP